MLPYQTSFCLICLYTNFYLVTTLSRILTDELWNTAKARQTKFGHKKPGLWRANRPQYLLSGLTKCGECDGGYSKINEHNYGCSTSKNKGMSVCSNRLTIKRATLENHVLSALQTRLMREDLIQVFCEEYTKRLNLLHRKQNAALTRTRIELGKLEKERVNLIQALKDGVPTALVKDDLIRVTDQKEKIEASLKERPAIKPFIHPAMATRFHQSVKDLRHELNQDGSRSEASQLLRTLVDKIVLTPKSDKNGLSIDLYGDFAGILNMATEKKELAGSQMLERLQLLPINDNYAGAFQKSVGCGERIRTSDLRVMSPTSYRTAPPRESNLAKGPVQVNIHDMAWCKRN